MTRGLSFVPLYVLGFAQPPVFAYVLFVSFQAVLIHANVGWRFAPVRWLLATPQYHHWHHAVEPVDVNFAVHLPLIDAVFGTLYLPRPARKVSGARRANRSATATSRAAVEASAASAPARSATSPSAIGPTT